MPSSASESIPYLIEFTRKNRPDLSSVLDVGVGFGKIGFLFREYFDVKEHKRFKPEDWVLNIVGVDVYEGYFSNLQSILYNKIVIGDIFDVLPNLEHFDLAVLGDVLEHFSKEDGYRLLDSLFEHVEDIVIATPNGFLEHPAKGENTHEAHKSGWTLSDFEKFSVVDSAVIPRIRKNEEILVVYLRK